MKQKRMMFKNKTYVGKSKGGKVIVYVESTAPGQLVQVGIYDGTSWENNSKIPRELKAEFEKISTKKSPKPTAK